MGTNSEARKRVLEQRNAALFDEPQWQSDPACCDLHGRVLAALREVYGTADHGEAVALADALADAGLIGNG